MSEQSASHDPSRLYGDDAASIEAEISGDGHLRAAVEAICMVADEPVSPEQMASVLGTSAARISEICSALSEEYANQNRGFVFSNVAGGWRYQSAPSQAAHVEDFVLDGQNARMSGAALETLAIIAYKQPISRAQIAAIRGVSVDGVLKTLQQRGYVNAIGQIEGAGQAQFFGTSSLFLEKLGIASLEDLPPLGAFIPGADLVETLEQGLRPSAALDLDDADALGAVIQEEAASMSSGEELSVTENLNEFDASEATIDLRDTGTESSSLESESASSTASEQTASADDSAPKKRWWRSADRS